MHQPPSRPCRWQDWCSRFPVDGGFGARSAPNPPWITSRAHQNRRGSWTGARWPHRGSAGLTGICCPGPSRSDPCDWGGRLQQRVDLVQGGGHPLDGSGGDQLLHGREGRPTSATPPRRVRRTHWVKDAVRSSGVFTTSVTVRCGLLRGCRRGRRRSRPAGRARSARTGRAGVERPGGCRDARGRAARGLGPLAHQAGPLEDRGRWAESSRTNGTGRDARRRGRDSH